MPDFCQTMSSLERILKAYEGPDQFFLHNINAHRPCGRRQFLYDHASFQQGCANASTSGTGAALKAGGSGHIQGCGCSLVEPDGVEPTTSCLQSRRSTN